MVTKRISPQDDNEGGLGRATKRWAEGHFKRLFNTDQTFDDVTVAPDSPASGKTILYSKAGKLYSKISTGVESLVGLSLGTGHTDAAYGDHDHDADYAPIGQIGVPTGGAENQILAKNSATSGDLKWLSISSGGMSFEGFIDCNANPNYPSSTKGCIFVVSVAGHIGGASGPLVEQGDQIYCLVDNAGGTHAAVGSNWNIQQANLDSSQLATAYAHSQAVHSPSDAEKNVNADWESTTGDSEILNKPTLGTAAAKDFGTIDGNLVEIQTGSKLPALDGSLLTNLPSGVPLGETELTAYRGDRGKAAYDHSQTAHAPSNANNYVHPNHSGDVTSVADGAQTIAANAVTFAKIQKIAALTVMGNDHPTDALEPQALTKNEMLALLNVSDGAQPCDAILKSEIEAVLTGEISSHSHAGGSGGSTAKVSADDTTAGYLSDKVIAGTGISITVGNEGVNETLIITNTSGGGSGALTWSTVTGTTHSAGTDNGYNFTNAALATSTLNGIIIENKTIRFLITGSGKLKIAQAANQVIKFGAASTTTGETGYLQSTGLNDTIELLYIGSNTFIVISYVGVWEVV